MVGGTNKLIIKMRYIQIAISVMEKIKQARRIGVLGGGGRKATVL